MSGMGCLDRRVIAGLAAVALAVMVFAPSVFGRALPVLVAAACPIGMLVMMRGATAWRCHRPTDGTDARDVVPTSGSAEEEIARLRLEVERLRAPQERRPTSGNEGGGDDQDQPRRTAQAEERHQ